MMLLLSYVGKTSTTIKFIRVIRARNKKVTIMGTDKSYPEQPFKIPEPKDENESNMEAG